MTAKDAQTAKHDEAVHLAEEAVEELQAGNEDEARFVLEEAKRLDPDAVEDVLHDQAKSISGVPGAKPAGRK